MHTLQELLSKYIRNEAKLQEASQEVAAFFAKVNSRRARNQNVEFEGVTYKYCSMSQKYFPIEDFVNNKNYTKAAYRIWNKFYTDANKMVAEAKAQHSDGVISDERKQEKLQKAAEIMAEKDNMANYEALRSLGKDIDELR